MFQPGDAGPRGGSLRRRAEGVRSAATTVIWAPFSFTTSIHRRSPSCCRCGDAHARLQICVPRLQSVNCSARIATLRWKPDWRKSEQLAELPRVDSNHRELINSQSCCRYITGDRRPSHSSVVRILRVGLRFGLGQPFDQLSTSLSAVVLAAPSFQALGVFCKGAVAEEAPGRPAQGARLA